MAAEASVAETPDIGCASDGTAGMSFSLVARSAAAAADVRMVYQTFRNRGTTEWGFDHVLVNPIALPVSRCANTTQSLVGSWAGQ